MAPQQIKKWRAKFSKWRRASRSAKWRNPAAAAQHTLRK